MSKSSRKTAPARTERQRHFWFNDAHQQPLPLGAIDVDGFAGGGGASVGLARALGSSPHIAINHDRAAIEMHMRNHPTSRHFCENIFQVDPVKVCEGRQVRVAWFSPDCTHYSKARGEKPVKKKIRGLAWVVIRWAEMPKSQRPRVIFVENVEEFKTWGPVDQEGKPIKAKAGVTFDLWVWKLRELGYQVEWRELRASDFGAPTTRKRLFIIARCDGKPIVWPEPTHGSPKKIGHALQKRGVCNLRKWRTAAEIIDWSIACPSIFLTPEEAKAQGCKRPLKEKSLTRIAEGVRRFVIESPDPFIVRLNHGGDHYRGQGVDHPLSTVTGSNGYAVAMPQLAPFGAALQHGGKVRSLERPWHTITASDGDCNLVVAPSLAPFVTGCGGRAGQSPPTSIAGPMTTLTAKADRILVSPTMIQVGWGEREGQRPRALDVLAPLGTVVAGGGKHAVIAPMLTTYYGPRPGDGGHRGRGILEPIPTQTTENRFGLVSAFIAKHFGGMTGVPASTPFPTITSRGTQNQVVAVNLIKNNHGDKQAFDAREPLRTVMAGGNHHAVVMSRIRQVRAFLFKYYGSGGQWADLNHPTPTITSKDRLALGIVVIGGELWQIIDIGMRMLTPRELFNAMGFAPTYVIDVGHVGRPASKKDQVARCGNSVCPDVVEAIVRANVPAKTGVAL